MKRSILIELTPLLDVILILLFLVLTSVSTQVEAVQAEAEREADDAAQTISTLEAQLGDAVEKQTSAERALTSFTLVDENCRVITLTLSGGGETRLLTLSGDGRAASTVSLSWDEDAYAKNALNAALGNAAKLTPGGREQAVFFVFQYDRRKIYQQDYALVHDALLRLSGGNVYFAEYDMTK